MVRTTVWRMVWPTVWTMVWPKNCSVWPLVWTTVWPMVWIMSVQSGQWWPKSARSGQYLSLGIVGLANTCFGYGRSGQYLSWVQEVKSSNPYKGNFFFVKMPVKITTKNRISYKNSPQSSLKRSGCFWCYLFFPQLFTAILSVFFDKT